MAMRGAELPFWCGFAEAKKLGIFPRKGSKSVRILRPQLHSSEKEASNGEKVLHSWASYRPVPPGFRKVVTPLISTSGGLRT